MGARMVSSARPRRRAILGAAALVALAAGTRRARASHYVSLEGLWLYRAFRNLPDQLDDYARLRLATGMMEVIFFAETRFFGALTATDYHLNLFGTWDGERFAMRATQGSPNTAGWAYEFSGWVPQRFAGARDHAATFLGTGLRLADHRDLGGTMLRGGECFSFIAIKHPDGTP